MPSWILIIGGLVLAGIVLDLIRRTRNAGRDSYEIDFNMQQGLDRRDPLEETASLPELPVGKARTVARGDDSQKIPATKTSEAVRGHRTEPSLSTPLNLDDTQKVRVTPSVKTVNTDDDSDDVPVPMLMDTGKFHETSFQDDEDDPLMGGSNPILSRPRVVPRKSTDKRAPETLEVIVINVMARQAGGLGGAALLETVLSCGLRYGEMNIFHYHYSDEDSTSLFSMANILKPGTFDLNKMETFQTPGVSLFMALPLANRDASAMETFEKMLGCAKKIAQNLDGDLRDENRSVMTGQTIEYCRQRISDFYRKHPQ